MSRGHAEVLGLLIALSSLLLLIAAAGKDCWRPGRNNMEKLPADVLAMRVALVGICLSSVLSILIMIPGLRCTTLVPRVLDQGRLLQLSVALCLCGDVCGAVGLLWYGVDTYTKYRQEVILGLPGITSEFGLSYWLMVASVLSSLPSAALALWSVSSRSDTIRMQPNPAASQPAQSSRTVPRSHYKTYI